VGLIPPPSKLHSPGLAQPESTVTLSRLANAPIPSTPDRYRLGDGYLEVRSSDRGFSDRLHTLYGECAAHADEDPALPIVRCDVRTTEGERIGLVTIEDDDPVDHLDFALDVFGDRGYGAAAAPEAGWRMLVSGEPPEGLALFRGNDLLVDRRVPWRALAGSLAVSQLMRLQRGALFFHAASLSVGDRGLLIVGGKGAGKTTLACALGVRGHAFLGDEIAALRSTTKELIPVRRSITMRPGPRSGAVAARLDHVHTESEAYPDGTKRLRVRPLDLFGHAEPLAVRLGAIVFLRGFSATPRLARFEPKTKHVGDLTPVAASLYGLQPARRVFEMLSVLTAPCYDLWMGGVDETARLVEREMENRWY